jgi:hypothetical protein
MSAQSLPVRIRPHVRTWQFLAVAVLLVVAAALALTLGRTSGSTRSPGTDGGRSPAPTQQVVGGNSPFQYHPLP